MLPDSLWGLTGQELKQDSREPHSQVRSSGCALPRGTVETLGAGFPTS